MTPLPRAAVLPRAASLKRTRVPSAGATTSTIALTGLSALAAPQAPTVQTRRLAQPAVQRDVRFKHLSPSDVAHFEAVLGAHNVLTEPADLAALNTDWMHRFTGSAMVALRPRTVDQVAAVMRHCAAERLALVPQGGNTGLVGGSVPVFDEVILLLGGINQIQSFDADTGVVVADAGVVLETLDDHVAAHGYRVPLDLGAKGSCQIGGNVATNAGGSRFIRYGSLRASVLGLEAVLPDGSVLDALSTLKKDNTGYDVKQLLIGSEGTLGVITKLAIACPVRSAAVNAVALKMDDFDSIAKLLFKAKTQLGDVLSAFEFMDDAAVRLATQHLSHVTNPLEDENDGDPPSATDVAEAEKRGAGTLLLECAGSSEEHNRAMLDAFMESVFEDGLISNGVIAESETQAAALWELRESLPEAMLKAGPGGTLKYDLSLPLRSFYAIVTDARARVAHIPDVYVSAWGHIGDGNLHLNVSIRDSDRYDEVVAALEPWVYEYVARCSGSISAEHGIGLMKASAIGYSKSGVALNVMRAVKDVIDPLGICNPYKVLPPVLP